ncbi:MAG: FtsQ-type POTRA domain-containing protein [Syntrophomonadaceae bacterium]|nr:FtsQ-type POTRA domain-containing protein [Syntrophomonadaceae bacterium]
MKKKSNRNSRKILLFLVLCLCGAVACYYVLHSSIFDIAKIAVLGNERVSNQEIIQLSGVNLGTNTFDISTEASAKAIEIIPWVKQAEVKRNWPDKIIINIVERLPWAIVVNQKDYLVVDDEGVCLQALEKLSDINLPVITMVGLSPKIPEGQKVNTTGFELVKSLIDALPDDLAESVSEYHYTESQQVLVYTLDGIEIRLGDSERLEDKIQIWRQVIKMQDEDKIQGRLEYIDLRYKGQPVIHYKQ